MFITGDDGGRTCCLFTVFEFRYCVLDWRRLAARLAQLATLASWLARSTSLASSVNKTARCLCDLKQRTQRYRNAATAPPTTESLVHLDGLIIVVGLSQGKSIIFSQSDEYNLNRRLSSECLMRVLSVSTRAVSFLLR